MGNFFLILVRSSLSYSNFFKSPRVFILRRVNLPGLSYPGESISPGYHTPQNQSPRGMIPWGVNKIPPKHDSPGSDSPGSRCKELSIRSFKSNTFFMCIIFLAGTEKTDFNSFSKTCLTSSKLARF